MAAAQPIGLVQEAITHLACNEMPHGVHVGVQRAQGLLVVAVFIVYMAAVLLLLLLCLLNLGYRHSAIAWARRWFERRVGGDDDRTGRSMAHGTAPRLRRLNSLSCAALGGVVALVARHGRRLSDGGLLRRRSVSWSVLFLSWRREYGRCVCVISELKPKGWLRPVRAMALKMKESKKRAWSLVSRTGKSESGTGRRGGAERR